MGGNALSVTTSRLPKVSYDLVKDSILGKLKIAFPTLKSMDIQAYAEKPDFGDLDILIEGGPGYDPFQAAAAIGATEVVLNGDATSVGVAIEGGVFQVDLIKITPESFDFASKYFAMNDLGNLLGRVAQKAGFKLGHRGLLYVLRDEKNTSQVIAELVVTYDWNEALKFIGYNPEVYAQGFNTLKDIFEFTVTSPYANKDIYLLENVNAVSRIRDRKRKTYTEFLGWLKTDAAADMPRFDWSNKEDACKSFLQKALDSFPTFKASHQTAIEAWKNSQIISSKFNIRSKFNDAIISEKTGLSGKDIGEFICEVKGRFLDENSFKSWILLSEPEEINALIVGIYGELKNRENSEYQKI